MCWSGAGRGGAGRGVGEGVGGMTVEVQFTVCRPSCKAAAAAAVCTFLQQLSAPGWEWGCEGGGSGVMGAATAARVLQGVLLVS